MKTKNYLFLLAASLLSGGIMSQNQQRTCGTMEHLEMLKTQDPGLESRMTQIEQQTALYQQTQSAMKTAGTVINIPVVVHVLYNTTAQNISDAQIRSQIDVLNEDFRRLNADKVNTPSAFSGLAADVEINFCLASKTPSGLSTTGIVRKSTTKTSFTDDAVKYSSSGGDDAWNTSKYLNLWVCNLGGGLLGYAQFPGGPAATDGVVVLYSAFGRTGTLSAPYNKGRTTTHEVGHWLNLRHIWGDASCGSDLVNDTPTQQTSNYSCPSYPHKTCANTTSGDMFMNYMDYTDDGCMNMFSVGQKTRMQSLFASTGARYGLVSSTGCGAVTSPTTTPAPTGTSNTVTVGSGTGTTNTPYGTYYMDEKVQYIITKAELTSAGYSPSNNILKSLAFNVASASTQMMNGFTIKLKHTTATSFGSTSFLSNTGMTTVYSANTSASAGWKTHAFTTPFTYNGTDNLLVEICFDNSAYTTDSKVYYSTATSYNTLYLRSDVSAGGTCNNTTGTRSYNRPNMRFVFSSTTNFMLAQENNEMIYESGSALRTIPKENHIDFQLAPNPATSVVKISYYVESEDSNVSIKIYNIMGKLVTELAPQQIEAGNNTFEVNLDNAQEELPSGVYLCALSVNDEVQTKKFMLLK
jgi:hypothetical protein